MINAGQTSEKKYLHTGPEQGGRGLEQGWDAGWGECVVGMEEREGGGLQEI